MDPQRAIFVPGYGVTEAIRAIRFFPQLDSIDQEEPRATTSSPQGSATLEVWQGDRYGEPTKELLTTFSTADRMTTVYLDGEMPLVRPRKSAVAIIHDAHHGYEIEFESEFNDPQDRAVRRTVTLDNYGTARESLYEIKSSARLKSIPFTPEADVRSPHSMADSLRHFVHRITRVISRFFHSPANETSRASTRDIAVTTNEVGASHETRTKEEVEQIVVG